MRVRSGVDGTVGVTTIGGYLGAGKTTLINRLLRDATGRRIAVLVNDFGGINIDAALIQERSSTTISLTNGCACCVLGDELALAFASVAETTPPFDHVVVEASGVADPRRMAEWAHLPGLHSAEVVVVADVSSVRERSVDRYVGSTVRRQLAGADRIVLSRLDVVSSSDLVELKKWISEIAPHAVVRDSRTYVLGESAASTTALASNTIPAEDHVPFVQCTVELRNPVDLNRLLAYFASPQPGLARAKGFVDVVGVDGITECHLLQVVGQEVALTQSLRPADQAAAIVFIGHRPDFDPDLFPQRFHAEFCT